MNKKTFNDLVEKINNGTATDEELAAYNALMNQATDGNKHWDEAQFGKEANFENSLLADINSAIGYRKTKVSTLWPRIAAAASVLIMLGAGTWFLVNKTAKVKPANDVAPYTAVAILKSGGRKILLDSTANGPIAQTQITKTAGEQLAYATASESPVAVYDTLQIPAGGRPYTVKLSDGSKITLNAATTLVFPEAFTKDRKESIELIKGEVYAQIVHNPQAPLTIKAPGQLITDIGTEFNISAYPDEPDERTTLVEGSVKVNARAKAQTLVPGQQTILTADNFIVAPANIRQTIAWKEGMFRFNGENIYAVMRQLARWYNIEVIYQGKVTSVGFYGKVTRNRNISEVLRILERSQKVKFKVEGRRVTVLSTK